MMYEIFEEAFALDAPADRLLSPRASQSEDHQLDELILRHGGHSFKNGLYRVLPSTELIRWRDAVARAFPELASRITPFAVDWLGRIFALDSARSVGAHPGVIMCEPGTATVLNIPCNLLSFHDEELIEYQDAALAVSFYTQWRESGGAAPAATQCIGYKKPLFLGGEDVLTNLVMWDLDVYWEISAQLIAKARVVPVGTAIKGVVLS